MQRQLPDGLIVRSLSENHLTDRERLPDFYVSVFTAEDPEDMQNAFRHWIKDLMEGHPTVTDEDIFVVVDPAKDDQIVSATLLIPQVWRYATIELPIGRPELVATLPDYRNRGLVRALFDAVHERSEALGHNVQTITGIAHFYRQFGYTMAVDLGQHAVYPLSSMHDAAPDYKPTFALRPATVEDIPNLIRWGEHFAQQRLLSTIRTAENWHYELAVRDQASTQAVDYQIIVDTAGNGVGYLAIMNIRWDKEMANCLGFVVGPESSYLATFEDVIRALKVWAAAKFPDPPVMIGFGSGIDSTLDTLIDRTQGGVIRRREYSWYIRVADPIRMMRDLTPLLESRLEGSGANCYTGSLKIGFYDKTGMALNFERGKLTSVEPMTGSGGYDIAFPNHSFWNVVFGQHGYDDLRAVLPEVWASAKVAILLDALFPKQKSWLVALA